MLVKDLIKELKKLPQDASIGISYYDYCDGRCFFNDVVISDMNEYSDNSSKQCNYYVTNW